MIVGDVGVLTDVSVVASAFVEILYKGESFVRDAALFRFDAIPAVHAVLAFPWEDDPDTSDMPAPVVKPRGFPEDVGNLVLSETTLYIEHKKRGMPPNPRAITAREARKLRPFQRFTQTYYFDPDVKYMTWLSREEVRCAAEAYAKHTGHGSSDLMGVLALMDAYERDEHVARTRLVVWFT